MVLGRFRWEHSIRYTPRRFCYVVIVIVVVVEAGHVLLGSLFPTHSRLFDPTCCASNETRGNQQSTPSAGRVWAAAIGAKGANLVLLDASVYFHLSFSSSLNVSVFFDFFILFLFLFFCFCFCFFDASITTLIL